MNYLNHWIKLSESTDESSWFSELCHITESFGFEQIMYATIPKQAASIEEALISTNYSPAWRQIYAREGMAHIDPTVSHCMEWSAPLIWSNKTFVSPQQKEMFEEASKYGLISGVTLPIRNSNQQAGMLTISTSSKEDIKPENFISHLSLLRDIATDTKRAFLTSNSTNAPALTKRELECLKWTAAGKSTWEISRIISCSEATVNFHIKNIREKFGVGSRGAAVVKAMKLGLI